MSKNELRARAFETIVYGGLAVGVLDILDAMIFFGFRNHVKPIRILQSIAVGVLGRASYSGGLKTALLGGFLHFVIAFLIATVFYTASRFLSAPLRWPAPSGLLFGVAAYFVMTYVVVPLSAVGPRTAPIPRAVFINGIVGHALLIGLPVALIARWSATRRS